MTFLLPADLVDETDRPGLRASQEGARASGNPLVSFYAPQDTVALARKAGLKGARHVSGAVLAERGRRAPTAGGGCIDLRDH